MRDKITEAEAVGIAIQSARSYRGLKASDLAAALGMSASTISKIENGTRAPDVTELYEIAKVLRWPVQWLMSPPFPEGLDSVESGGSLALAV
jgi:transcriptional regulator with XRE-family HTH domain